jgi:A/G-specific adenine glycosylase
MLQQTQVSTVKERYQLFMKRFPTVKSLAKAQIDEVMALWSGLGYYSRARNLYRCAQTIMTEFSGEFPRDVDQLESLPGIGRSTAGAIAAFAYQARTPILDANVKRVLSRFFGITGDLQNQKTTQQLWAKAQELLPKSAEKMPIYTQALMDFGATWCTLKQAKCMTAAIAQCPMMKSCIAYQSNRVYEIPAKKKKSISPSFQTQMFLVECGEFVLLERRKPKAIWGGLYSLPELPWERSGVVSTKITVHNAPKWMKQTALSNQQFLLNDGQIISVEACREINHIFSHRRLKIFPHIIRVKKTWQLSSDNLTWVKKSNLEQIGLPQPIRLFLESSSR